MYFALHAHVSTNIYTSIIQVHVGVLSKNTCTCKCILTEFTAVIVDLPYWYVLHFKCELVHVAE